MNIEYHRKFVKTFVKLPEKIKSKFYEKLLIFEKNPSDPVLNNHSVEYMYPDCRSINVTGDYRALFKSGSADSVMFMKIGTHSELYE